VDRINAADAEKGPVFRWTYIVLPAALFIISLILTAAFFPQLSEQVAYHFQDGTPDRWLSRGMLVMWMVAPQVFFILLAFLTVRLILTSARYWPAESSLMRRILPVMGNMLVLPQIVLAFAMLDIYLYNAYQVKLNPSGSSPRPSWPSLDYPGSVLFQIIRQARRRGSKPVRSKKTCQRYIR
jgi:hypothetical protein